eukprot:COSAG01_NODE_6009_length_3904_cov_36.533246_4_plen_141_part_01
MDAMAAETGQHQRRRRRVTLGVAGKATIILRVMGDSSVVGSDNDDSDDSDSDHDDDDDDDAGEAVVPARTLLDAHGQEPPRLSLRHHSHAHAAAAAAPAVTQLVQLHVRVHGAVALARGLVGVLSLPARLLPAPPPPPAPA